MRAVLQRVSRASVHVGGEEVARIGPGLLVLLGVLRGDTAADADWLADRSARLRCFSDERGRMNRSLVDVAGELLLVSQFTLSADGRKGLRPSFDRAAAPEVAAPLVDRFRDAVVNLGVPCRCGVFGAEMRVELVNEGPATFCLEHPLPSTQTPT